MATFPMGPEFDELKAKFDAICAEEKALYDRILSPQSGLSAAEAAEAIEDIGARKASAWNEMLKLRLDKD